MKKDSHNEDSFKKLVKESGLESPSRDFTASIMKMVAPESQSSLVSQPVFNKKQIAVFVILFGGILIYALLSGSTFSRVKIDISTFTNSLDNFFKFVSSPIILILVVSGWTLYIFDRLIKRFSLFRT